MSGSRCVPPGLTVSGFSRITEQRSPTRDGRWPARRPPQATRPPRVQLRSGARRRTAAAWAWLNDAAISASPASGPATRAPTSGSNGRDRRLPAAGFRDPKGMENTDGTRPDAGSLADRLDSPPFAARGVQGGRLRVPRAGCVFDRCHQPVGHATLRRRPLSAERPTGAPSHSPHTASRAHRRESCEQFRSNRELCNRRQAPLPDHRSRRDDPRFRPLVVSRCQRERVGDSDALAGRNHAVRRRLAGGSRQPVRTLDR